MAGYKIFDARNGNVQHGVYCSEQAAGEAVKQLNEFVHRNSSLGFMHPSMITGPFYYSPENQVETVARHYRR